MTAVKTIKKANGHVRPIDHEARQLAVEKLESSGLTEAHLQLLQLDVLSGAETQGLHPAFQPLPAIRFNYLGPDGAPLRPLPQWPPFYRLRYLKTPNDVASKLTKQKPRRYVQPPSSGVAAYLPPNMDGWTDIFLDPEVPLIITEGELKAAKACDAGLPTIGLGGVFNFRSAQLGIALLPELEAVEWRKRYVYLIYDSDFRTNELVCWALKALADELFMRGALPHFVPLPELNPEGKTGLDDYLVQQADPGTSLRELIHQQAQPLTLSRSLWQLNEQVLYVQDPGLIIKRVSGQKLSPAAFKDHHFAAASHVEQELRPDGTVSLKQVSAAKAWLGWPLRHEVGGLGYFPGKPKILEADQPHLTRYNTWPGWGAEPEKGDVGLWLRLLDYLFTGAPEAKAWFIRWLASPVQHPGTKLFTYSLIHGIKHGTGKSLVGYTLGRVYGRNFTEITQNNLEDSFNGWMIDKQFVLADDVTGSDKRHFNDKLKKLVTQQENRINEKFIPSYTVPDCLNWLFTSNQPDSLALEDNDRRAFIHEVPAYLEPLPEEFYMDYDCWLHSNQCGPAMHHWLLQVDLEDFNPNAPALRTAARERMISDVRSDLGSWVRRLINDPEMVLRVGDVKVVGDLFTNRYLLQLYDPMGVKRVTANGLGRELRRAGVPQVCDGQTVPGPEGPDRYYILRNHERWMKATRLQIQKYLQK
jgi:hypothetical protein